MWSTFMIAPEAGVAPQHIHRAPYFFKACIRTLRHSYEDKNAGDRGFGGLGFLGVGGFSV